MNHGALQILYYYYYYYYYYYCDNCLSICLLSKHRAEMTKICHNSCQNSLLECTKNLFGWIEIEPMLNYSVDTDTKTRRTWAVMLSWLKCVSEQRFNVPLDTL